MMAALAKDVTECGARVIIAPPSSSPWAAWAERAAAADLTWPIAPETGGALERLTRLVPSDRLLGCRADAVAIAASKRVTTQRLAAAGVPVAPIGAVGPGPFVVKPDDGAGCVDTLLVAAAPPVRDGVLVQPFIDGKACSLTMLTAGGAAWLLTVNRQHVAVIDGRFRFSGVTIAARDDALDWLAEAIAAALPGLWGVVGVDFVMTAAGPVVLEVNPRLTTAYVGLAEAIGTNPAALVLALRDQPLARLRRKLATRPVRINV